MCLISVSNVWVNYCTQLDVCKNTFSQAMSLFAFIRNLQSAMSRHNVCVRAAIFDRTVRGALSPPHLNGTGIRKSEPYTPAHRHTPELSSLAPSRCEEQERVTKRFGRKCYPHTQSHIVQWILPSKSLWWILSRQELRFRPWSPFLPSFMLYILNP
jgi:hypothetical protein